MECFPCTFLFIRFFARQSVSSFGVRSELSPTYLFCKERMTAMRPVQPYFALSTNTYYKRQIQRNGIAHFYDYKVDRANQDQTIAIPDGCIDLIFDYGEDNSLQARAFGSVLNGTLVQNVLNHEYFGVRFQPGVLPGFLKGSFAEYVGQNIALSDCCRYTNLEEQASQCRTFDERILLITAACRRAEQEKELDVHHTMVKDNLVNAVMDEILKSSGNIRIQALADITGYSSRYIDRVFKEYTGMSPKTFCRITRFQNAVDRLDHDNKIPLSDLAADCGYYDQPQFIRDFRRCMDTTPRVYRQEIVKSDYISKFVMV